MDSDIKDNSRSFESYLYWAASKFTDPVCYVHETLWRYRLTETFPIQEAAALPTQAILSVPGATTGAAFRWLAANIQEKPYIYSRGDGKDQQLPEKREFTHLLWNICCVGAGYSMTDGGVVPWKERIDSIADKIIETDADVNSIYETIDIDSAFYLSDKLKQHGYNHCFFNIGPNAIGASSGILIASKYKIANPEFTPFPEETLVGRTKYCKKGIFRFDLMSENKVFATVLSTHLQHSEEPEFPTSEEVEARKQQMAILVNMAQSISDRAVLINGDLNLDDQEYAASSWKDLFEKGTVSGEEKTWGGDFLSAQLVGKRASGALNLDHAMVVKGSAKAISSTVLSAGFDETALTPDALSDHNPVLSKIVLS